MSSPLSSRKDLLIDGAAVLSRWVLGGLFVWMGLQKALHPEPFIILVRQYELVTNFYLLNVISAVLPWFEVFCGLLVLAGIAVRGCTLVMLALLMPFTLLILKHALALASAGSLALCAVKFDCGCGNGEVYVCHKLAENSLLILLAAGLLCVHRRRWCARFSLW